MRHSFANGKSRYICAAFKNLKMTVKPYNSAGETKKSEVKTMFNTIAPHYDFLNHALSFGIDKLWRKKAIRTLADMSNPTILDVATGTGDFAIQAHKILKCKVIGSDLSPEMLAVAKEKAKKRNLSENIEFVEADSEHLPFDDEQFDAVTVAFGARNYENLDLGLSEMARVLKTGGRMVVLEFSRPRRFPFKQVYMLYFKHILPRFGGMISHDKRAYEYLPQSVLAFPDGEEFEKHFVAVGMKPLKHIELTFGIATIYVALKQ